MNSSHLESLNFLQGIYRVNGVKTRVEKLCQAFENGKELVELSQASPHDISNVLKLYLRQVRRARMAQPSQTGKGAIERFRDSENLPYKELQDVILRKLKTWGGGRIWTGGKRNFRLDNLQASYK